MLRPEEIRTSLSEDTNYFSGDVFKDTLTALRPTEMDPWFDRILGIESVPDDSTELPTGCVPYLPCDIYTALRAINAAEVTERDVFIDIGSGLGRVTALAHFLTGASAIGVEIQSSLVSDAQKIAANLSASRLRTVQGDAANIVAYIPIGTVFFLYCPFTGTRLERIIDDLESIAITHPIRICGVQVPPIQRNWLIRCQDPISEINLYRSCFQAG